MKKIVVLVSGGGTNLQALIDAQENGIIKNGRITCVISSKEGVYALERAKKHGIPSRVIPRKDYPDAKSYSQAVLDAIDARYPTREAYFAEEFGMDAETLASLRDRYLE